jgi:hypothetical protein
MSTLRDFDVNQLMLMLHGELQQAFNASQSAEKTAKLRVEQVNVKMGQRSLQETGSAPENHNLLDPERYPDKEDWEVNISYRYGGQQPGVSGTGMWVSSADSGLVLERMKDVPVRNVKGIDRIWETRLLEAGILTIGDLANCPAEKIRQLCGRYKTLQPLEFQTLVLLLARDFTPLRFSEFYQLSLPKLLMESNAGLKRKFGGKLSEPEISGLKAMAAIICTIIDKSWHQDLTLDLLSPGSGSR